MFEPAKVNKKRPYRLAYETADDTYLRDAPLLKVSEEGTPGRKILIDKESKDIQTFWREKAGMLWFIIVICSLYFLLLLTAY